jgi:hypothetical protein
MKRSRIVLCVAGWLLTVCMGGQAGAPPEPEPPAHCTLPLMRLIRPRVRVPAALPEAVDRCIAQGSPTACQKATYELRRALEQMATAHYSEERIKVHLILEGIAKAPLDLDRRVETLHHLIATCKGFTVLSLAPNAMRALSTFIDELEAMLPQ